MLIPPKILKVSHCAATSNSRYAINGMLLKRDPSRENGLIAAATDGHCLMLVKFDDHSLPEFPPIDGLSQERKADFSTIVPLATVKEMGKLIPKNVYRHKPILNNLLLDEATANGMVKIGATNIEVSRVMSYVPQEGHFPNYEAVVPQYRVGEDAVEIGIDAHLLAECASTLADVTEDTDAPFIRMIVSTHPNRPMLMTRNKQGVDATAVVMPCNLVAVDGREKKQPPTMLQKVSELRAVATSLVDLRQACGSIGRMDQDTLLAFDRKLAEVADTAHSLLLEIHSTYETKRELLERIKQEKRAAREAAANQPETPDSPNGFAEAVGDVVAAIVASASDPSLDGPTPTVTVEVTQHCTTEPCTAEEAKEMAEEWAEAETEVAARKIELDKERAAKSAPATKRVKVKALRDDPDKHAPGSGCRCRRCGANAHRSMYNPKDTWLVLNGYAFCPPCEPFAEGAQ